MLSVLVSAIEVFFAAIALLGFCLTVGAEALSGRSFYWYSAKRQKYFSSPFKRK